MPTAIRCPITEPVTGREPVPIRTACTESAVNGIVLKRRTKHLPRRWNRYTAKTLPYGTRSCLGGGTLEETFRAMHPSLDAAQMPAAPQSVPQLLMPPFSREGEFFARKLGSGRPGFRWSRDSVGKAFPAWYACSWSALQWVIVSLRWLCR